MFNRIFLTAYCLLGVLPNLLAGEPLVSGVQVGSRPGPYSFLVATGTERGQSTCYVCETEDRPGVIIFTRKLSEPVGKFILASDRWLTIHPKDSVRSWVTVLGEKTATLDELAQWSKQLGVKKIPLGVFDDPKGPPSYKLNAEAEVTILLFVKKKVVANYVFKAGEFNDDTVEKIMKNEFFK